MARPGFVLEVDDRTPPLAVPSGDGFRLERFPLGTRVVYPGDPIDPVPDIGEAIAEALDAPLESAPLSERLRAGMRLTIAFDDNSTPVPAMPSPDIRARIIEAVLTRAAAAGVDDVALICANGLNRRLTPAELEALVGERVFRSFFADDLLTNHDAEDLDAHTAVGATEAGVVSLNARVAQSDLLVYVHVAVPPNALAGPSGGPAGPAERLTAAGTVRQIRGLTGLQTRDERGQIAVGEAIGAVIGEAVEVFEVDAVLDNDSYTGLTDFLGRREWEWRVKDRVRAGVLRQGLRFAPTSPRRRAMDGVRGGYRTIAVNAGAPIAVRELSRDQVLAQQRVEIAGQSDVAVVGVPFANPYGVDSVVNPILAAWSALAGTLAAHVGMPVVREGGALIAFHPLSADFSPLHQPSYVDFFGEALTADSDPYAIQSEAEQRFATDAWYAHLYRTSHAFHGVHPVHRWYEIAAAREHLGDVVWVGADRANAERMGFRAASTLADALEIVGSSVGHDPTITFLHSPPAVVSDVR
ncbi:lactate racemase domain-containing protein [Microlunatus ginsengisoli]|uniref:LarA-like N-terminal domain-containing protein n=1 Tax=Microlunatus ginsengisoli TaxID=363863 RepID=A0ABP6ZC93_9ACTN